MDTLAVYMDNRGMNYQLINCAANTSGMFYNELVGYNYTYPPWSVQYPESVNDFSESPCVPVFNDVRNNSYCNCTSFTNVNDALVSSWNSTFTMNDVSCMEFH
jgi:hypothetical protein